MSLVPLFNIDLPANFREFSKNLAVLHGEPQSVPNIFELVVNTDSLEPFNKFFELMNFKTKLLLLNAGRKITIWMTMIFFMGVSYFLLDMASDARYIGSIVRKFDMKIRYGMLIRGVSQFYLSMALSAILNFDTISWNEDNTNYATNFSAIIGMGIIIYIPVKSFNIIYRTHNLDSNEFQNRYKTIIAGLKTSSPL